MPPDPRAAGGGPGTTDPVDTEPVVDEKVIGWLTDFDNPSVETARIRRLDRRLLPRTRFPLGAVLTLAAGAVAAWAIAAAIEPTAERLPDTIAPVPTQSSAPPTPSATPAPEAVIDPRLPDRCSQLFGNKITRDLDDKGLALTARWTATTLPKAGSLDPELRDLLSTTTVMECYWLQPNDKTDRGILTAIGSVDSRESRNAVTRAVELGMTKSKELGGTRYYLQETDAAGNPQGESHFFRDGLWFATRWWGYGPYGYTADMAEHVFR